MNLRNLFVILWSSVLPLVFGAESARAIQLEHTYSPSRVVVGGKLTYTYSLQNNGAADESCTLFTNKLPVNSIFVSAVVTNGEFTISNNVFSFRPERLWAGETTMVQVVVTPATAHALTNRACWVSSAGVPVWAFSLAPVDSAVAGPEMHFGRFYHTSTTLNDGRVLVVGGQHRGSPIDLAPTKTAEVYIQAEDSFAVVRLFHSGRKVAQTGRVPI